MKLLAEIIGLIVAAVLIIITALAAGPPAPAHILGGAGDQSQRKLTYYISERTLRELSILSNGQSLEDFLAPLFRGWRRIKGPPPPAVDFIFGMTHGLEGRLYPVKAVLKYRTDMSLIDDKVNFHAVVAAAGLGQHIAETYEIADSNNATNSTNNAASSANTYTPAEIFERGFGPWIVRANFGYSGSANTVVTNASDMTAAAARFYNNNQTKEIKVHPSNGPAILPRVIASKYIDDPMLWRGHKFHARVILLVLITPTRRIAAIVPPTKLISSALPYKKGDYSNNKLHDTHASTVGIPVSNLDTMTKLPGRLMVEKTTVALREICPVIMPLIKTYPEAENSYDFLGVDVMYQPDATPVILEMNALPGIKTTSEERILSVFQLASSIFKQPDWENVCPGLIIVYDKCS